MARQELSEILEAARGGKGGPSYETIAKALDREWFVNVTGQTVSNYHRGAVAKPDLEIVQALIGYYELALADMPREIRLRLERQRDQLVAASARHPSGAGERLTDDSGKIVRHPKPARTRDAHAAAA